MDVAQKNQSVTFSDQIAGLVQDPERLFAEFGCLLHIPRLKIGAAEACQILPLSTLVPNRPIDCQCLFQKAKNYEIARELEDETF